MTTLMLDCSASSSIIIVIRVITPRRDLERLHKAVKRHREDWQHEERERLRRIGEVGGRQILLAEEHCEPAHGCEVVATHVEVLVVKREEKEYQRGSAERHAEKEVARLLANLVVSVVSRVSALHDEAQPDGDQPVEEALDEPNANGQILELHLTMQ